VHSGGWSYDLLSAPKRLPEAASTYKQMALNVETVFYSSMLVHIISAYDFVRMISLCI